MLWKSVCVLALLLVLTEPVLADDPPWLADARQAGLSDADAEKLAKQRVLITNQSYLQIFSPYVGSPLPPFITSDSILDGYFALLEESLSRMERANADLLPDLIRVLWTGLADGGSGHPRIEDPDQEGLRRARILLATAGGLLRVELAGVTEEVARLASEEVARIEAAEGHGKPEWLGPPDPGFDSIDYRRFKPKGIYTRSQALTRYFRAVSWLQAVPFRLKLDTELSSILLIARGLLPDRFGGSPGELAACRALLRQPRDLVGPGDDFDLLDAVSRLEDGNGYLWEIRRELLGDADRAPRRARVNDQAAYLRQQSIRVISAAATPDAILFMRTAGIGDDLRAFPAGLAVAGLLGSDHARSLLSDVRDGEVFRGVKSCRPLLVGDGLYMDTLRCLSVLFEPPDDRAPGWMGGPAWKKKTVNTALAGWARLRHSLALHIKVSEEIKAIVEKDPGHVEPVPKFYEALGRLAWMAEAILLRNKALQPDPRASAEVLFDLVSALERALVSGSESLSMEEWELLDVAARRYPIFEEGKPEGPQIRAYIEKIGKLARDVAVGEARFAPCEQEWLIEDWRLFRQLCERLKEIAEKELSGDPLNRAERSFIAEYGEKLATLYGYGGNAWLCPRDDAPRIIDVHKSARGKSMLVGVARARALYVLVNSAGGDVLCRGAVRPYYEFVHEGPLNDVEWRERLDSDRRPAARVMVERCAGRKGARDAGFRKGEIAGSTEPDKSMK